MEINSLEHAREIIAKTDAEIADLFVRRMRACAEVAAYKGERGLPIFDPEREAFLLEKNSALIEDPALRSYYSLFQKSVMDVSKQYQSALLQGLRVAYCGVEGAFAHIAALRIFPGTQPVAFGDFADAYQSVLKGSCDCCVLPFENSYAGEVGQVLDLMYQGDLYVNGVYALPVVHDLLGIETATVETVRQVVSHPQALMQCAKYTADRGYEILEASNTAVAAKLVAERNDPTIAAIASEETALRYGLKILDHDVNASSANTTRFAVFSRVRKEAVSKENTFILLFTLHNEVGALAKAVNIISSHGFDMRVLRSRPVKDVPWQYYFYVEAVGDQTSDEGKRMLHALSVCCEALKVAGHYTREIDLSKREDV